MPRNLFIAGLSAATVGAPLAVVGLLVGAFTDVWVAWWASLGMAGVGTAACLTVAAGRMLFAPRVALEPRTVADRSEPVWAASDQFSGV